MSHRPADIVSGLTDTIQPPRVSAEDAVRAGRKACDKPTPDNAVMLLIDHQIGLMAPACATSARWPNTAAMSSALPALPRR